MPRISGIIPPRRKNSLKRLPVSRLGLKVLTREIGWLTIYR